MIDYPHPQEFRKGGGHHFAPIDFVPKRKPGHDILGEMQAEKDKPLGRAPGKLPQNRGQKIEDLQERF